MQHVFSLLFLVCCAAGVVSECISIAVPHRILAIAETDPAEVLGSPFYRVVLVLSALYLCAVVMMFVSGVDRFRVYGALLVCLSAAVWILRGVLLRNRLFMVAESTLCLVMLCDSIRTIFRGFLS
jgi:hypothetical protein